MKLINTCFRKFIFLSKDLFFVSELKRLDKFLISCDVVGYLSDHFHQKIRHHAIVSL